ncbi:AAA ATPase [Mortierella sp. GBA30]|nr:AAA ATPase [Mortierella sp. GBA30]
MTFLRKRAMSFSDNEDEVSYAHPPTPTKRMSGVFFRLQTDFSQPVATPSFKDIDDVSSEEEVDSLQHVQTTAKTSAEDNRRKTRDTTRGQDHQQPSTAASLSETKVSPSMKAMTPPHTPTRRTTRQQQQADSSENIAPVGDSDDIASTGTRRRMTTGGFLTPKKTPSRFLAATDAATASSSSSSNRSAESQIVKERDQHTTGLTPAMNKMMRSSVENTLGKPKTTVIMGKKSLQGELDENAQSTSVAPSYSTPKRLQKTKSQQSGTSSSCSSSKGSSFSSTSSVMTHKTNNNDSIPAASALSTVLGYYQDAKTLFRRTAEPHRLVGRDAERELIRQFCRDHILNAKAGSLYISGQPGTGKTALLNEVLRDMESEMKEEEHQVKRVVVNCMTVKDPRLIYNKLLEELGFVAESKDKDLVINTLESLVLDHKKNKTMYLVILDEIDQLLTKDQDVLYKLFEWSSMEHSKLMLIGIANALDMTDRFLPRLKAKNCEPQLLNFNPYQVAEIRAIILDRLFSMEDEKNQGTPKIGDKDKDEMKTKPRVAPLMQRPAIELCARKVAAATGDLRKALDICRQTIEMVEMETKKKERLEKKSPLKSVLCPLSSNRLANLENQAAGGADPSTLSLNRTSTSLPDNMSTSAGSVTSPPQSEPVSLKDAPKVTVEHVKKALASAFGSPMAQKMKGLNMHQKIVLAVLVVKIQAGKAVDCEVGKVFEHYMVLCRSSNKIGAVNRSEYQDLVNMLEACGLITLGKKVKEERLRKIGLVPREDEVLDAIKGQDILDTILLKAGILPATDL